MRYDLEQRTKKLSKNIIILMLKLPITPVNRRMIEQVVASGGSIGANYCEANEAESKKDFIHKIGICKKEIKETRYWLDLISTANPNYKISLGILIKETHELLMIFSKIIQSCKNN